MFAESNILAMLKSPPKRFKMLEICICSAKLVMYYTVLNSFCLGRSTIFITIFIFLSHCHVAVISETRCSCDNRLTVLSIGHGPSTVHDPSFMFNFLYSQPSKCVAV